MQEYLEKFKALSDETRLRIVHLLIEKNTPLCVCEFTDALEVPQYNISRHLKILKLAKLIEDEVVGVGRKFGTFVINLFDVGLCAHCAHDVGRIQYPLVQPRKALRAHALGQDRHTVATERT